MTDVLRQARELVELDDIQPKGPITLGRIDYVCTNYAPGIAKGLLEAVDAMKRARRQLDRDMISAQESCDIASAIIGGFLKSIGVAD